MHYLTVDNIAKSYGEVTLFENVTFSIHKGQKVAFVAKNGSGKTTILNILAGKDTADSGGIILRNDITLAYLPQHPNLNPNLTVEKCILGTDNKIIEAIAAYEKTLKKPEDEEAYQKAFERMERLNAWDFETQYKQVLFQLKLTQLHQKVGTLSGGEKRRLALAIALLDSPDLLILDEPTNHLDLDMIEWLEDFLKKSQMTLFMVTHDRYFLERVCDEIIELDGRRLYQYRGNYSYYLKKRDERHAKQGAEQNKTFQLYKKELDWMRRQPQARTTKSKSRVQDFYQIEERAHQRRKEHSVQLEINMERLGNKVIELHNVSKSMGGKTLFEKFNYNFKPGERVGIIGRNGSGKSTFLNMLTQKSPPDTGKVVVGETVRIGYYTQNGIEINPGQKVIDVIRAFGEYIPLKKGRQISAQQLLERFLFDRKKQYDFVEKLSGGEQKRLYLCVVLIQNPNILILDEPTNDLDIVTLNVLENFLLDFPGNLFVVSHDRYFMDKVVDHLFVFRDGNIEDFPGNYSDWRVYEESRPPQPAEPLGSPKGESPPLKGDGKLSYKEKKELNNIEGKLKTLERDKKVIEKKFDNPGLSPNEITELSGEMQQVLDEIEGKEMRWMELVGKVEG